MNSVTLLMRRLVAITKTTGNIPPLNEITATVDHYGAARQLTRSQRVAVLGKLCDALMRL